MIDYLDSVSLLPADVLGAGVLDWTNTKQGQLQQTLQIVIPTLAIILGLVRWVRAGFALASLVIAIFIAALAIVFVTQVDWFRGTVESEITGAGAPAELAVQLDHGTY